MAVDSSKLRKERRKSKTSAEFIRITSQIASIEGQGNLKNKNEHEIQGVIKKMKVLCVQERFDEALECFEKLEDYSCLRQEDINDLNNIWNTIQQTRKHPQNKSVTAKGLFTKLRMFFAAGAIDKARTVAEAIQELYHSDLEGEELAECLLIFQQLKEISANNDSEVPTEVKYEIPYDSSTTVDASVKNSSINSNIVKEQHRQQTTLAIYILAYSYNQDPDSVLPETKDLIQTFVDKKLKKWKGNFNPNMICNIAEIIREYQTIIFKPYYSLIEDNL